MTPCKFFQQYDREYEAMQKSQVYGRALHVGEMSCDLFFCKCLGDN